MVSRKKEPGYRQLIEAAKAAAELAYRPYSKYNVGAAVLTFDGKVYVGCNVENAGYSQTVHAEETAICNAIADGALKRALDAGLTQFDFIVAIAVHAPKGSDPWPCCNCRQFMSEFGLKMDVIGYAPDGTILCRKLKKLIPFAFPIEEVLASVNGTTATTAAPDERATHPKGEEKKGGCGHHAHGETHAHGEGHKCKHAGKHDHSHGDGAKKTAGHKCGCKAKKNAKKDGK
jgi:cytidine deaminase